MQRYTNLAIAGLLLGAVVTGLLAQATGTPWARVPAVLHGIVAFSLVVLTPWKSLIAGRGLQRRRAGSFWSIALAAATITTVASGLVQMSGTISKFGPLTTMQLHVGGAVVTVGLAIVHYVQHPVRPRPADLNRRAFLRSNLLGIGGAAAWLAWEGVVRVLGWPGAERRFTGSHERGSGNPEAMPTTQWLNDTAPQIDRADWRVVVGSHVLRPPDVDTLPLETLDATLDCTSGWYSTQAWRGIRLDRLLDTAGAASIDVRSVTGYSRRFPPADASRLWLAFEVGGAPLSAGHGFPARLVAPGRRGFWWVKWVDTVAISGTPWWLQLPFPLE